MSRAGGAFHMSLATVTLALLLRASLPGGLDRQLPPGIYHGWVGAADGRFQLAGRPCAESDALLALELPGASGVPSRLSAADVSSYGAAIDSGSEVVVTALSAAALRRLTDGGSRFGRVGGAGRPQRTRRATRSSRVLAFTRLKARCRSWRELDTDIGHASVVRMPERETGLAPPFEAHVLPVPDRTPILALLLLWNRSLEPVVVKAVGYAPEAAATGRVLAAVGGFEQFGVWKDYLLGRPITSGPRAATSGGGRQEAAPGPGPADTAPTGTLPTTMNAADLDLRIAAGGIALIAFDDGSFRPVGHATTLLSYPVVDYLVGGVALRVGLTTPLYSTSLRSSRDFALPAVLHSLFAASSPVGPAALFE